MSLSKQEEEWVRLTAESLASEITKQVIIEHIQNCPIGQKFARAKWFLVGVCSGCCVCGTGAGFALVRLFLKI